MPERSIVSAAAAALLACTLVTAGCAEETPLPGTGPGPAPANALGPPRAAWQATKASCGGVYHYSSHWVSSLPATGTTLSVEISHDRPTRRDIEMRQINGVTGMLEVVSRTTENAAELAARPAAAPPTMEQLYDQCELEVLTLDRAQYDVTFEPDRDGVLRTCFYRPKNCVDDCQRSVGVDEFGCGPLP